MPRNVTTEVCSPEELLGFILAHQEKLPDYALLDQREHDRCRTSRDVRELVARHEAALEQRSQGETRYRLLAEAIVGSTLGDPARLPGNWIAAVVIENLLILRRRCFETYTAPGAEKTRRALRDAIRRRDQARSSSGAEDGSGGASEQQPARGRPRETRATRERKVELLIRRQFPWLYESSDWHYPQPRAENALARAAAAARFLLRRQKALRYRTTNVYPEPGLVYYTIELAILERLTRSGLAMHHWHVRQLDSWKSAALKAEPRTRRHAFPAVPGVLVDRLSESPNATAAAVMLLGHTRSID